jgi:hypothetical protein
VFLCHVLGTIETQQPQCPNDLNPRRLHRVTTANGFLLLNLLYQSCVHFVEYAVDLYHTSISIHLLTQLVTWPLSHAGSFFFKQIVHIFTAHTGTTPRHYKTTQVNRLQNRKILREQVTRQQQDIKTLTRKPGNNGSSSPPISIQNTWKSSRPTLHSIQQATQDIPQPRARTIWNNLLLKTTFDTMYWYNV